MDATETLDYLVYMMTLFAVLMVILAAFKMAVRVLSGPPIIVPVSRSSRTSGSCLSAESARLWGRHLDALAELESQYTQFETDPWLAFRRPLLADVTEPQTADFHDALRQAQDLRTDEVPALRDLVDEFGAAVRAATRAWEAADKHAREVAVPTTTDSERRRLRQAEDALSLALDERTSSAERRVALGRVEELIKGLTTMPPKAHTSVVAELDHVERRAINQ